MIKNPFKKFEDQRNKLIEKFTTFLKFCNYSDNIKKERNSQTVSYFSNFT